METLHDLQQALRISEERLHLLARTARDIVWDWNLQEDEIWWSDQFFNCTHYEKGGGHWSHSLWTQQMHPEDRQRVQDSLKAFLESGTLEWNETYRFLQKNGAVLGIKSRSCLQKSSSGENLRMVGTLRTVPDAGAGAVHRELNGFFDVLSHDLRAPLRHINGFLSLLDSTNAPRLDEDGRRYLENIAKAAGNMSRLVEGLLSFLHLDTIPLRLTRVDIGELAEEVCRCCEKQYSGRTIHWHLVPLPSVRGDPLLLRQALIHLVGNALKFSQAQPVTNIEIGGWEDAGETVFFIKDNGPGFAAEHVAKLFHPFQRLHSPGEFAGVGLGLASVKVIVEDHGGRVWAESGECQGATFFVALPRRR